MAVDSYAFLFGRHRMAAYQSINEWDEDERTNHKLIDHLTVCYCHSYNAFDLHGMQTCAAGVNGAQVHA